jgi:hypothetical protein
MNLRDIPPLRTLPKTIDAACYNRVRLALMRMGSPLRLELPRQRMNIVLADREWMGIAPWQVEMPMLVWTEFRPRPRQSLHEPVSCVLHLYHVHAGLVMGTALDGLDELLIERLAQS